MGLRFTRGGSYGPKFPWFGSTIDLVVKIADIMVGVMFYREGIGKAPSREMEIT